jgi:hypothetical protein
VSQVTKFKKDGKKVEVEVEGVEELVIKPSDNKYWYYCDACSNEAFESDIKALYGARMCQKCGKVIDPLKEENYIEKR